MFNEVSRRHEKRKTTEMRKQEIEDSPQLLEKKCERMAKAIQKVSIASTNLFCKDFPLHFIKLYYYEATLAESISN